MILFHIKHFPKRGVPVDWIKNASKTQNQSRNVWNVNSDKNVEKTLYSVTNVRAVIDGDLLVPFKWGGIE